MQILPTTYHSLLLRSLVLTICCLNTASFTAISQNLPSNTFLLKAQQAYYNSQTDTAAYYLKKSTTDTKTDQQFKSYLLAQIYYKLNQWDSCIAQLQTLDIKKDVEIALLLARSHAQNKQPQKSLTHLGDYLASRHAFISPKILQNDSSLLKISNSKQWVEFWKQHQFTDIQHAYNDAKYEFKFKRPHEAIQLLTPAISKKKHFPSWLLYASIEWSLGHTKNATAAAQQAYKLSPKQPLVAQHYIEYLLQTKKTKIAQPLLLKSIKKHPYYLEFYRQRAVLLLLQKEYDLAETYIQFYDTWLPTSIRNWEQLAQLYIQAEDYQPAMRYLSQCIAQKPDAKYYKQRGICYYHSYSYKYAQADLSRALDIYPNDALIWNYQALIFHKQGNRKMACYNWKRARKLGHHPALLLFNEHCPE